MSNNFTFHKISQHHERVDGSGYPLGLKENEIVLEAQIIAVADVVEAMNSHRPYRPALGLDAALTEIKRQSGTGLSPKIVDACIKILENHQYELPSSFDNRVITF